MTRSLKLCVRLISYRSRRKYLRTYSTLLFASLASQQCWTSVELKLIICHSYFESFVPSRYLIIRQRFFSFSATLPPDRNEIDYSTHTSVQTNLIITPRIGSTVAPVVKRETVSESFRFAPSRERGESVRRAIGVRGSASADLFRGQLSGRRWRAV